MKRTMCLAVIACLLMNGNACLAQSETGGETPAQQTVTATPVPTETQKEETPAPEPPASKPATQSPVSGNTPTNKIETPSSEPTDGSGEGETSNTSAPNTPADGAETSGPSGGTNTPDSGTPGPSGGTNTPDSGTPDPSGGTNTPDSTPSPSEGTDMPGNSTPDPESTESAPSAEPSETPTAAPEIPDDAEVWLQAEGQKVGGKLQDLIALLKGGEDVFIYTAKPVFVEKAPLRLLSRVRLLPDTERFKDGKYIVNVSMDNPEAVEAPELLDLAAYVDAAEGDVCDLYIWVVRVEETPPVDPTDEPEGEEVTLQVEAADFEPAVWRNIRPTFTLSGSPEDKNWPYAVVVYDERIAVLSGDVYTAEEEGVYTLRFAILDEIGDIVDASEKYTLWLDCTPPENVSIEVDPSVSYTLHIAATDAMSGVESLSMDGGATWMPLANGEVFTYTGKQAGTIEPGMIQVRDVAGNIFESTVPYELIRIDGGGYYGGGGGGGGGGTGTPAKTHASGDGEDTGEYDALQMELPEEPMHRLTIDGQEMELELKLDAAEGFDVPADYQGLFTASLAAWKQPERPADAVDEDAAEDEIPARPDTLILTAEMDANLGDRFTYVWRFNGEVYRLLANSGIRYLALQVGDDLAVFPTEGFTGGTRYTELKMLGVSTRNFDYAVYMKFDLDPSHVSAMSESDFSRDCDLSIRTEVENMAYELSSSPTGAMYFYDVYLGPVEMMEVPYGEYSPEGH